MLPTNIYPELSGTDKPTELNKPGQLKGTDKSLASKFKTQINFSIENVTQFTPI